MTEINQTPHKDQEAELVRQLAKPHNLTPPLKRASQPQKHSDAVAQNPQELQLGDEEETQQNPQTPPLERASQPGKNHSGQNSFVVRARGSRRKQEFIANYRRDVLIEPADTPLNWREVFAALKSRNLIADSRSRLDKQLDEAKMVLEIGFGKGEVLLHNAVTRPQDFFIGMEVYPSGVYHMLKEVKRNNLSNLAVMQQDAVVALRKMFEDQVLDEIQVLFPDPWPKKRHHKRRLLTLDFMTLMVSKLKPGGLLHMATDWQEYAEEILAHIRRLEAGHGGMKVKNLHPDYAPGPQLGRPATRFEQKGLDEGRKIYEFLVKRV